MGKRPWVGLEDWTNHCTLHRENARFGAFPWPLREKATNRPKKSHHAIRSHASQSRSITPVLVGQSTRCQCTLPARASKVTNDCRIK
eukprot:1643502-Lingulodinium_polyedra.AAC.1